MSILAGVGMAQIFRMMAGSVSGGGGELRAA
jgi:hypothetical protein